MAINHKKNIGLLITLIIALSLRLYNLGRYTLWYDEATVVLNKLSLDKLYSLIKLCDTSFLVNNRDALTLFCYGFMYPWQMLFGKSEFILRLPSVIFGILSVYLMFIIAKNSFGAKSGYLSSLLLAISPLSIYYSQELRPYAAICFLTLLSAYSLLMLLKDRRKRYIIIYILSNSLNVYFHCAALGILASFIIFITLNFKKYRHFLKLFSFMHFMILLLIAPVLFSLYANACFVFNNKLDRMFSEYPIWGMRADFKQIFFTLKNFTFGYNIGFNVIIKIATLIYFILFLFGFKKVFKEAAGQLFFICLLTPILSLFLISRFLSCYIDRYIYFVLPFYLLFIALGMDRLKKGSIYLLLIIYLSLSAFGLLNYYRNYLPGDHLQLPVWAKQDMRGIIGNLLKNYQKGDKIFHTCKSTIFPLKFYIKNNSKNPNLLAEADNGTCIFIDRFVHGRVILAYDYNLWHPPETVSAEDYISLNLSQYARIWLISSSWNFSEAEKSDVPIISLLNENFTVVQKEYIQDTACLYLFENKYK